MDEHGFTPIDVVEWHGRRGRAMQLDVLFGDIAALR
jgi:homogentisate 1,2-dioxygenase